MKKKYGVVERQEIKAAFIFIAPQIFGYVVFVVFPIIFSLYLCFSQWDMMSPIKFTGLDNIIEIFHDTLFIKSIFNNIYFVLVAVPVTIIIALFLAVLCSNKIKGLAFYKSAFFLPMVTSSVAISMVFYWIFAKDFGLLEYFFDKLNVTPPLWLQDPFWGRITIVIVTGWLHLGYYFLILFAGLQGISNTYYEAAIIDGANAWQKFWRITLPLLSPVIFFIVVALTINIFNMFNEPYILTDGGPQLATYTITMYIYNYSFQFFKVGQAAVASWVLFIMIGSVTFLQFKLQNKVVNYDV